MTSILARPTTALLTSVLALALVLTGCSGGTEEDALTPRQALASAKRQLDRTSGVEIAMSTPSLPASVSGITEATGVGTHAPAFSGEIRVSVSGVGATVPVRALDGTTYAILPFTQDYSEIDPADYGAPDPAGLLATEGGLSSLLTSVQKPSAGEQVRAGSSVLTQYTGSLPGSAVTSVIPGAPQDAEFTAAFTLDDGNRLSRAMVAGPFYGEAAGKVTYTIEFTKYGITPKITAP